MHSWFRSSIPALLLLLLSACDSTDWMTPVPTSRVASPGPVATAIPSALPTSSPVPPARDLAIDRAPTAASGPSESGVHLEAIEEALDTQKPPPGINPLTGLPVADPSLLERRPMAIKISNYPRDIRPQFGLNEADVVFEYYIEWGYTRFIGIFHGADASQIGPVRSGRYFDEHITRMYQAYYVFNFADPREYTYFLGGDLQQFMVVPGYGSCPPFFQQRVSSLILDVRHYETYFDSTRFAECLARKGADNSAPVLRATYFSATRPLAGAAVDKIYTYYSRCDYNYWAYDEKTRRYLRFQEGSPSSKPREINECSDNADIYLPLLDSVTDARVYADNVVVIYASHTFATANEQDDEIYHIDLVDSGRAYVFRDGLAWPARWVRTDIDQPLILTTYGGEPFALRPGRTFFQVLGESSRAWSDGADWHFEFSTP